MFLKHYLIGLKTEYWFQALKIYKEPLELEAQCSDVITQVQSVPKHQLLASCYYIKLTFILGEKKRGRTLLVLGISSEGTKPTQPNCENMT